MTPGPAGLLVRGPATTTQRATPAGVTVVMAQRVPQYGSMAREMIALLREWGVTVATLRGVHGARSVTEARVEHGLYLLTSATEELTGYAAALEAGGATCLNTTHVMRLCNDRVRSIGLLAGAGVPVPQTWTASDPGALAELVQEGPIVIKPVNRSDGPGGHLVWDVDDLVHMPTRTGPILAQRFHTSQHRDRKLYRVGDQLFGIKRTWPARSYAEKVGETFAISAELREITERVGAVLGTDLFAIDLVMDGEQPIVVDLHPFPALIGVPDGALRLADYVYAVSRAVQQPGETIGGV